MFFGEYKNDFRDLQKKKEYARELEHQIELKKERERQEKLAFEEFEKRYHSDDRSFGQNEQENMKWPSNEHSQHESNPFTSYNETAAGEQDPQDYMHYSRFRITDYHEGTDRLKEKAQQMEWKRILDEQIAERERLRKQEEEERRRIERELSKDELAYLREQHLRAQRKQSQRHGYRNEINNDIYESTLPNPPNGKSDIYGTSRDSNLRTVDAAKYFQLSKSSSMPPPAPTASEDPTESIGAANVYAQASQASVNMRSSMHLEESKMRVLDEYRLLLYEIRQQREELRREKEEIRKEKEELRMERALLQLENEKMVTLLEQQRILHGRQLELQRGQLYTNPSPQMTYHPTTGSVQSSHMAALSSSRHVRSLNLPSYEDNMSREFSQMDVRSSMSPQANVTPAVPSTTTFEENPSPVMTLEDFGAPETVRSSQFQANKINSPRLKRLSRFREPATNSLEQSLRGSSIFVSVDHPAPMMAVEEEEQSPVESICEHSQSDLSYSLPKDANSPVKYDPSVRQSFQDSRIIKSTGYYDLNIKGEVPDPVFGFRNAQYRKSSQSQKASTSFEPASSSGTVHSNLDHNSTSSFQVQVQDTTDLLSLTPEEENLALLGPPKSLTKENSNNERLNRAEKKPLFQVQVLV